MIYMPNLKVSPKNVPRHRFSDNYPSRHSHQVERHPYRPHLHHPVYRLDPHHQASTAPALIMHYYYPRPTRCPSRDKNHSRCRSPRATTRVKLYITGNHSSRRIRKTVKVTDGSLGSMMLTVPSLSSITRTLLERSTSWTSEYRVSPPVWACTNGEWSLKRYVHPYSSRESEDKVLTLAVAHCSLAIVPVHPPRPSGRRNSLCIPLLPLSDRHHHFSHR